MQLYPNTGHGFDRGGFAPGGRGRVPILETGDSAAATDAWTRTIAFFQRYLH
jgi:dienelactone hydrolase